MAQIKTFITVDDYFKYEGEFPQESHDAYLPVIVNRKVLPVTGNPYTERYSLSICNQATRRMHKILSAMCSSNVHWKVPKRTGFLK